MKLRYPKWLRSLVLPFESPDHPLYADPLAIQQREVERERIQNLSPEEFNEEVFGPDYISYDEEIMELIEAKSTNSDTSRGDH